MLVILDRTPFVGSGEEGRKEGGEGGREEGVRNYHLSASYLLLSRVFGQRLYFHRTLVADRNVVPVLLVCRCDLHIYRLCEREIEETNCVFEKRKIHGSFSLFKPSNPPSLPSLPFLLVVLCRFFISIQILTLAGPCRPADWRAPRKWALAVKRGRKKGRAEEGREGGLE